MEGEDSEKPEQNEDEEPPPSPEESDKTSKTSSLPPSRGASTQSAPTVSSPVTPSSVPVETKSLLKPPSIPFENKSSVVLRTSVPKASPSEKLSTTNSASVPQASPSEKLSTTNSASVPQASPSEKLSTTNSALKTSTIKFTTDASADQKEDPPRIGGKSKSVLGISANLSGVGAFPVAFFSNRSPFIHNPPEPEERRERIQSPRSPREYIINLREDLADFQESHGLPRSRDYSFVSLGLALAQETARALYSVFLMFAELFPILSIVSLILRFALDKLIEILETPEPVVKIKKSIIFGVEMLIIVIPMWILIGTIVLPMVSLIFSIITRVIRLKGSRKKSVKSASKPKPQKPKPDICSLFY